MSVLLMQDQALSGKRVLIREDLNVPIKEGVIASDARIRAAVPGILQAISAGAHVIVMSHLGRPVEGGTAADNAAYSLAPVASHLAELIGCDVPLVTDWQEPKNVDAALAGANICLLENVRFNAGEKSNDDTLAKQYASLCDVFVMDAFGTAHRAQASTHDVAKYAPVACAGPLLAAELDALAQAIANPVHPVVAIVGGSKVSTKLTVLESLAEVVDQLVVGGGIANTFLAATGNNVGKSLCERELLGTARELAAKIDIPLPTDVVVGAEFSASTEACLKPVDEVQADDMIFDIGPQTSAQFAKILQEAKTIIWNGPVGVFEFEQFSAGTQALAKAIASSEAFSIAGGGDTLAAIDQFGVADQISYISTGGGAFLEFVEGKVLPAVAILEARAQGSA